eukprot:6154099-Lingulodinium_polyedra.AAC.1
MQDAARAGFEAAQRRAQPAPGPWPGPWAPGKRASAGPLRRGGGGKVGGDGQARLPSPPASVLGQAR